MREKEHPSPMVAAFMTLGIVGFWVLGYFITKDLRIEDIIDPPKHDVHEVLTLLDQYAKTPSCTSKGCAFSVWSR